MKNKLQKTKLQKNPKRLGRGYGSGKGGHTSGRGQKGQKSRRKIGILFEGVKMKKSLIKRLPLLRGRAKMRGKVKPLILNQDKLSVFKDGDEVNIKSLVAKGLVSEKEAYSRGVKILAVGKLDKKLNITVAASKKVVRKVVKSSPVKNESKNNSKTISKRES